MALLSPAFPGILDPTAPPSIHYGGEPMTTLTSKELTALEDQIGCEATLVKKYEAMACLCTDTRIQKEFNDFANRHRAHYNTLVSFLQ